MASLHRFQICILELTILILDPGWARMLSIPGLFSTQPFMHWISMRMPNRGGAEGGTPELYFSDPDGVRIQLQDPTYCGGGGYLGDSCLPLA